MGVAFSPDGRTLASVSGSSLAVPQAASKPGELCLWTVETGALVRCQTVHAAPLTGVSYHPSGNLIATSSWDRTIRLWDTRTGDLRQSLAGHKDWVLHVAFSPDGKRIATGGADGAIKIWDTATTEALWTLRGHTKNVTCVAFRPDGRRLASSSSDQTIKIWDSTASPEALTWRGAVGPIARIAYFPDGNHVLVAENVEDATGSVRYRLTILDTARDMRDVILNDATDSESRRPIEGIAIRRDGRYVASASHSGRIEAWTVPDGRSCFRYDESTSRFEDVAFSPNGRRLAASGQVHARLPNGEATPNDSHSNGLLLVFDLETGTTLWRVAGMKTGIIRDLAFSPDGKTIATADNFCTITIWDSSTGQSLSQLRGHDRLVSSVAFSPDGKKLASASWDSTVVVWDLASRQPTTRLQGHMRSVLCVVFSPDGRRLATSSEDQTVKLWDVDTGQEVLTLHGHTDIVPTVAFSPDGNRLATAGADGVVLIREASPAHPSGLPPYPTDVSAEPAALKGQTAMTRP
jgi:WD40 repeat protein